MLQNRHPFGTVLVLFSVTLLGVSCEPLERVMDGFPPPHISRASSRLLLGSSWAKCPTFSLFILCSFQAAPSSKPHQNIIKNCLHFACVLIAFQKTRTKTLLVCMNGQVRYTDCPFPKCSTLRGGYRKDRDCSRLFPLSVAAPRLVCRALVLSVLLDGCGYTPQPFSARIDTRSL